jgi:transcriptional regulator with XRE-family HTH domain
MTTKTEKYIESARLVEIRDAEDGNSIYRSSGFDGVTELAEIDNLIGDALRNAREKQGLSRPDLAPLLGLTTQVYGRYERGEAKMHVTRLIHLSELLKFSPIEVIGAVAPHLWGGTKEEADVRCRLMSHIEKLPLEKAKLLLGVVESFLAILPAQTSED